MYICISYVAYTIFIYMYACYCFLYCIALNHCFAHASFVQHCCMHSTSHSREPVCRVFSHMSDVLLLLFAWFTAFIVLAYSLPVRGVICCICIWRVCTHLSITHESGLGLSLLFVWLSAGPAALMSCFISCASLDALAIFSLSACRNCLYSSCVNRCSSVFTQSKFSEGFVYLLFIEMIVVDVLTLSCRFFSAASARSWTLCFSFCR